MTLYTGHNYIEAEKILAAIPAKSIWSVAASSHENSSVTYAVKWQDLMGESKVVKVETYEGETVLINTRYVNKVYEITYVEVLMKDTRDNSKYKYVYLVSGRPNVDDIEIQVEEMSYNYIKGNIPYQTKLEK